MKSLPRKANYLPVKRRRVNQDGKVIRRNIGLSDIHVEMAQAIGHGNTSEGIRFALENTLNCKEFELL